jgi:hypothetical protein
MEEQDEEREEDVQGTEDDENQPSKPSAQGSVPLVARRQQART